MLYVAGLTNGLRVKDPTPSKPGQPAMDAWLDGGGGAITITASPLNNPAIDVVHVTVFCFPPVKPLPAATVSTYTTAALQAFDACVRIPRKKNPVAVPVDSVDLSAAAECMFGKITHSTDARTWLPWSRPTPTGLHALQLLRYDYIGVRHPPGGGMIQEDADIGVPDSFHQKPSHAGRFHPYGTTPSELSSLSAKLKIYMLPA